MSQSVLVADCDPIARQALAALLPSLGAEPLFADDDEMAVRRFLESGPQLVWIDVLLPRQGGLALLRRLRGLRDGAGVAVLVAGSVALDRAFRKEAVAELGALGYCKKPLRLETLRSRLIQGLAAAEPAPVANPFAAPLPEQGGELAAAPSPRLLSRLAQHRVTGCLTVTRQRQRKVLYLRDGAVTFALSNQLRETLSSHLVARGRIDAATVQAGVEEMRRSGTRLGEFLIANGVLASDEVFSAIRDNVREKVLDLFLWQQGQFRMTPYREPPAPLPGREFPLPGVVWAGVREVLPLERLGEELATLGGLVLGARPGAAGPPDDLGLGGDDLRALRTLRRGLGGTLGELLGQVESESARRLLYYLLLQGYFTLGGESGAAEGDGGADPRLPEARKRLRRLRRGNHFQVLQVPLNADDRAVREAYRARAKAVHPDTLGPDDPVELHRVFGDTFQVIRASYDGLKTAELRQHHLRHLYGEAPEDPREEGNAVLQAEVHYQDGQKLLKRRDWTRAAELLAKAWELNPTEGEYALGLGVARARQGGTGRPDLERDAEGLLRRAHDMLPRSGDPAYHLGRLALQRGDPEAAAGFLRQALAREPEHLAAQRELRLLRMRGVSGGKRPRT
jgi:DNA-binding response OmpR family regulator/tetratricopeptide (TPR) repeat protein